MCKRSLASGSRAVVVSSALFGSLILSVACGNEGPEGASTALAVETLCTDGLDDDGDGKTDCDDRDCQSPGGDCVAAAPLDRSVASTVRETAEFLYSGDNPLQREADAATFEPGRLALLTGKVVDDAGAPLAGARVSAPEHPEYGYVLSRKDGTYTLAVNGGSPLVVTIAREGYALDERSVTPGWQRWKYAGESRLLPTSDDASSSTATATQGVTVQVVAPKDAVAPMVTLPHSVVDEPTRAGAVLVEPQALVRDLAVTGTPYHLTYQSHRRTTYQAGYKLEFPLLPAEVPATLKRVGVVTFIAGQIFNDSFEPKPNKKYSVKWDGRDGFGRLLQGPVMAEVCVIYYYEGVLPDGTKPPKPKEVALTQLFETQVGLWDYQGFELGGLGLDVLHAYDPALGNVYYGHGGQRSGSNVALVTRSVSSDESFDLGTPDSLVVAADGSLLVTDDQQDSTDYGRILRFSPDGTPSVRVGQEAGLLQPQGIVVTGNGSLIVTDVALGRVSRISPKGKVTILVSGDEADNPKLLYQFSELDGLALGPAETLYLIDGDRILKLKSNQISVFAGGGKETSNGVLATKARIQRPSAIVVDSLGRVVFSDRYGHQVRRVELDGTVTTLAGRGGEPGFSGDGGPARKAELNQPRGLALGPDGSLYIVDQGNGRVRRVTPDGFIQTVIGGGDNAVTDGVLSTDVYLEDPDGIAMGPDGALYIATFGNVLKVTPDLPTLNEKDVLIPSRDGRTLYRFDYRGRHRETIDAVTGVTKLKFGYKKGLLTKITDANGLETTITRDDNDLPDTIVAPYGQKTRFSYADGGYYTRITDPLDRNYELGWNQIDGRLDWLKDPTAQQSTFLYDVTGRLTSVDNPTGLSQNLDSSVTGDGFASVKVTLPSKEATNYFTRVSSLGSVERKVLGPGGEAQVRTELPNFRAGESPDGTRYSTYFVPDEAFGPQSLYPSLSSLTLPSGKELTTYRSRTKDVSDPRNVLTLETWLEESETNGRLSSSLYDRESRTLTETSPMGRRQSTTFDESGRPLRVTAPGFPDLELTYDDRGRVATVTSKAKGKSRTETRGYGEDGWLAFRKSPLGHKVQYAWDAVGRPSVITRPDKRTIAWDFNQADNVTRLTLPSGKKHGFDYDASSQLLTASRPPKLDQPGAGRKSYSYGKAHELTRITLSDGREIGFAYEAGQLTRQQLKSGSITYSYSKGRLKTVQRQDSDVKVKLGYDGFLPTSSTWSGAVSGSVTAAYDNNLWLSSLTVNDQSSVIFSYDDDGLVTGAGAMTLERDPDTGLVLATTLGETESYSTYDAFAELDYLGVEASNASLFGQTLERDALGRVTRIDEQFGDEAHELRYSYDKLGRLATATRDGIKTTYEYDSNGNRTSIAVAGSAAITANFDAQDRILTQGSITFEHSPVGNVASRTDGSKSLKLTYDELGNLTKAVVAKGDSKKTVTYLIDGLGRRVARQVNGTLDKQWLYRDALRPVAEIDAQGTLTHFVYADAQSGAPDFLIRAGVAYRVVKDHLGSVRLVINAKTGAVVQSLEYDAFGNVLGQTGKGFQPFGFAGGLYDVDTGLLRFGARDYDPMVGRWTSKDPIEFAGGQTNLYVYVGNDPVNKVDPTGTSPVDLAKCVYHFVRWSDAEDVCRRDYGRACGADPLTEECSEYCDGNPTNPSDDVQKCIERRDDTAYQEAMKSCSKYGLTSGLGANGGTTSNGTGSGLMDMVKALITAMGWRM